MVSPGWAAMLIAFRAVDSAVSVGSSLGAGSSARRSRILVTSLMANLFDSTLPREVVLLTAGRRAVQRMRSARGERASRIRGI